MADKAGFVRLMILDDLNLFFELFDLGVELFISV